MFKSLWKKKALIVFLAVLIVLFPAAAAKAPQMLEKTMLTSLGIDFVDDEVVIYGEMLVNQFDPFGGRQSEIVQASGINVAAAVDKLTAIQGRQVSLAHCAVIILGSGLEDQNIAELLRYFLNKTDLHNNVMLIYTNSDIEELMDIAIREDDVRGSLIQQITAFYQANIFGRPTSLESFHKDYMRHTSTSMLGIANLQEEEVMGAPEAEEAGGIIDNPLHAAVFKSGLYAFSLDETETRALNFLRPKTTVLRVIQDNEVINILSKRARVRARMVNGTPTANITIRTTVELESKPNPSQALLDTLKQDLESRITKELLEALTKCYSQHADILNLSDAFHRRTRDRVNLDDIDFNIKVDVRIKT